MTSLRVLLSFVGACTSHSRVLCARFPKNFYESVTEIVGNEVSWVINTVETHYRDLKKTTRFVDAVSSQSSLIPF